MDISIPTEYLMNCLMIKYIVKNITIVNIIWKMINKISGFIQFSRVNGYIHMWYIVICIALSILHVFLEFKEK